MARPESDEGLVILAVSGSHEAMSELISRYSSCARVKALRLCGLAPTYDTEDLFQEALLGLLSAVYTYKDDKQASFATYANVCMDNHLFNVSASARKKRNVPQSALVPLEHAENAPDDSENPETAVIAGEQAIKIVALFSAQLSDFEQHVFRFYLGGITYADIALRLGSTEKAVDNALQRAKRKLRTALFESNLS